MKMSNKKNYKTYIIFIFFGYLIVFILVLIKLFYLQVLNYDFYKNKAQRMHLTTVEQQIGRGEILDRNGNKLAMNIQTVSICANPRIIKNKEQVALFLSEKLKMPKNEILKKLKSKKGFVYIKRKIDIDLANEIMQKEIKGIFTQFEEKRVYPLKEIAAHVIGFTDIDNKGLEGIEMVYDKYLRGKKGRILVKKDARGKLITIDKIDIKKAEKGADIFLTIDSNIQYYAQKELKEAILKYKAKAGSVIVMNPETGEIYAIANYPEFDPNNFSRYTNNEIRNRAITDIFEPGSIFKIFTMSAFIKEYPDFEKFKIFCGNGKYYFINRYIRDHEKYGYLTVPEIIKYSSNIGMVHLALKISQEKLYSEYLKYGFGKKTGIDLPGEVEGILRNYKNWDNTTLTSIPYGQEIGVTAIQIACAYAIIANGGYPVKPYLVDRIVKNDKVIFKNEPIKKENILTEKEREKLVEMLELVVDKDGTGKKAAIENYEIAGKTGTAQKHDEKNKGYKKGVYVSSFIGFLPANKPKVLTAVILDEPKTIFYSGGDSAAPLFKNINTQIISYLKIPSKDYNDTQLANFTTKEKIKNFGIILPDFNFKELKIAENFAKENNIKYKKIGYGNFIIKQIPKPGEKIYNNDEVIFYLADLKEKNIPEIYMPDLKGLTVRKVLEILSVYGIKANCIGSGIVIKQHPEPGVKIEKGKVCTINFEIRDSI